MNKNELRLHWQAHVAHFQESKQTMKQWCIDNNQKLHQLQYWIKKFKDNGSVEVEKTKWLPVTLDATTKTHPQEVIKIFVGKCTVEVSPGLNLSMLKDVLSVLTELC
jgi:hypothetical protein